MAELKHRIDGMNAEACEAEKRVLTKAGKVDACELRQRHAVYYGLDLSSLPSDPS